MNLDFQIWHGMNGPITQFRWAVVHKVWSDSRNIAGRFGKI